MSMNREFEILIVIPPYGIGIIKRQINTCALSHSGSSLLLQPISCSSLSKHIYIEIKTVQVLCTQVANTIYNLKLY